MKFSGLRGILRYVPNYREKVFVIAIDGEVLAKDPLNNILADIAVLWSLRVRVVLVHGAGFQIRQLAEEAGTHISNDDGTGITDAATLSVSLTAANRLTHEIIEGLTALDLRSAYPNAIIAHPLGILDGVDHLNTGKVERVDTGLLNRMTAEDIIPVIPPLGFDGEGRTYRVNSDGVALSVARALHAAKLVFVTASDKLSQDGKPLDQLSVVEAEAFFKNFKSQIPAPLVSKVRHGIRACRDGVSRVHLINGTLEEALLEEVFLSEGVGTMIYIDEYQSIRPAKKKDASTIRGLIQGSIESSELINRSRSDILQRIGDFFVFETDNNIVGCVALHEFPGEKAAELACLYVHGSHENLGIGRKLVAFVERTARQRGCERLFAISTQAFAFFQQKFGFHEVPPDQLPAARRDKWAASGRKGKVLVKPLAPLER